MVQGGGTLKPGVISVVSGRGTDVSREVGGLSNSGVTFTLGGERPCNDVVAHGEECSSKGGPRGPVAHPEGAGEIHQWQRTENQSG